MIDDVPYIFVIDKLKFDILRIQSREISAVADQFD